LKQLAFDFRFAYFLRIKNNILAIVAGSIAGTNMILFIVLGCVLALSALAYYIGFFTTSRASHWNNNQLVALLYYVPSNERVKIQDMHTFIESGGAILN